MRVLGITDTDSYIKYGAALLDRMPVEWERRLSVIKTPSLPNERQVAAALAGSSFEPGDVPSVDIPELAILLREFEPDIVVFSMRGPIVRVIVRAVLRDAPSRPVLVGGMPGISYPETFHALYYRSQVDVLLLHSRRELAGFSELAESRGISQDFALVTLPFLTEDAPPSRGSDVVFAAQAKVPRLLEEREYIVEQLIEAARAHPERRVVVKLRSLAGEPQTHREPFPYDTILETQGNLPSNLVVSTEAMAEHLDTAGVLATVSSTAAIEAIARDVPVLLIDDFGLSRGLINVVFEGSGLFGPAAALSGTTFPRPDEGWLDDNYFHPRSAETWQRVLIEKVAQRDAGRLPVRERFGGTFGGRLRFAWEQRYSLREYDHSKAGQVAFAIVLPIRTLVRRVLRVRDRRRARSQALERATELTPFQQLRGARKSGSLSD